MIRIRRASAPTAFTEEADLSPVAALSRGAVAAPQLRDQIIREFETPYLELVRLLRESAEIEHALMVQYLFAAFTVKDRYKRLAGFTFGPPTTLLGVAIQEMQHLNIVCDLLSDLGAAPSLTSQDFPYNPDIYPFPLNLEPLSRRSLAKYVYTEAPIGQVIREPGVADPFLGALYENLDGIRPNHLGSIYSVIIGLTQEVAAHPPFALPDLTPHIGRLEFVKEEGEGDHFKFFKSVFLGTHTALVGTPDVWSLDEGDPAYPSIQVPLNPSALEGHPNEIADPTTRAIARLSNLHYWIILQLLDLTYRTRTPVYMDLAKGHMIGPLEQLGRVLASRTMGLPFDPADLGQSTGRSEADCVRILKLLLQETQESAEHLRSELPDDFLFDTVGESLNALPSL